MTNAEIDEEKLNFFRSYAELENSIRGTILSWTNMMEQYLESILTEHFVPVERNEELKRAQFASFFMNSPDFSFSSKIDMVGKLLKLSYVGLAETYDKLSPRITRVRKLRNKVAHAKVDVSERFTGKRRLDRVQFVFYEEGRLKQQVITSSGLAETVRECSELTAELNAIYEAVARRNSSSVQYAKEHGITPPAGPSNHS